MTRPKPELKLTPDKIDTDGVYTAEQLPIERYHGDCCAGHSVSGSDLVIIESETLLHYWHQSFLNPARERKASKAMMIGSAAHYLILGETEFAKNYIISPYSDFRTNEAKAWRDQQTRTILTAAEYDMLGQMAQQLARHPLAKNAFRDGKPEQSIIWKDPETGIFLKTRPDWLPNNSPWIPNLKTSSSANPAQWVRQAYDLGYHIKEALRIEGFRRVLQRKIEPYFIVQETKPPYLVSVPCFRSEDLEFGALLARSALRRLAKALDSGKFTGYADDKVTVVAMPGYLEAKYLDRHAAGEFENTPEMSAQFAERGPAKKGVYSK